MDKFDLNLDRTREAELNALFASYVAPNNDWELRAVGEEVGVYATRSITANSNLEGLVGTFSRHMSEKEALVSFAKSIVIIEGKARYVGNWQMHGPLAFTNWACQNHATIHPQDNLNRSRLWEASSTLGSVDAGEELTIDYFDGEVILQAIGCVLI